MNNSSGGGGVVKEPTVTIAQLGEQGVQAVWDNFHAALQPFIDSKSMGCVVFQFHLDFKPNEESRQHLLWCREKLRADVHMSAVY
jgi:uncharacterized protein YecE (DUF72 family)